MSASDTEWLTRAEATAMMSGGCSWPPPEVSSIPIVAHYYGDGPRSEPGSGRPYIRVRHRYLTTGIGLDGTEMYSREDVERWCAWYAAKLLQRPPFPGVPTPPEPACD